MLKPWSITTTIRNPERLKDILIVLTELEGDSWDNINQEKFQILLIQKRLYGYGSVQFYKGLSQSQIDLIDDYNIKINFSEAQDIFKSKNYMDPPIRGSGVSPFRLTKI